MAGIPSLCEAGWFVTGRDDDPVRHLFVRLEERIDGSGTWTLELHLCQVREGGKAMHVYPNEADARSALQAIYTLSQHLVDLPTWDHDILQPGRWRTRTVQATAQDLQMRQRSRTTTH